MKMLSIIVPLYNVESYIEKCLRSLENQDINKDDYEIICINDGSSDNSHGIVEGLQDEFDNIILIDQENQGVSCARNIGIDRAIGKYLLFIDADDFVDSNSLKRILFNVERSQAQVSFLGYTVLDEGMRIYKEIMYNGLKGKVYSGIEGYNLSRGDGQTDPDRLAGILLETEFINKFSLRYLPDVPYLEDGEFRSRILCLAERCIFDGYSFYQRTTRSGSATRSNLFNSEKATNGFLLASVNLSNFKDGPNLSQEQRDFLNQPIVKFVLLSINSCFGWNFFSRIRSIKAELRENGLIKCHLEGCKDMYVLYGKAYNFSPYFVAIVLFLGPRVRKYLKWQ